MKILVVNSSPMGDASVSRRLTQKLVDEWVQKNPEAQVIDRDIVAEPLPHLDGAILGAFFTPDDQRTPEQVQAAAKSDQLIAEVFDADVIVFGIPMHNFGLPSSLKAYIDHVARAGKTFQYTANGPEGLVTGKKVFVISARGGDYSEDSPMAALDFINPYMKTVLGFLGMQDVTLIGANGLAISDEEKQKSVQKAEEQVQLAVAA